MPWHLASTSIVKLCSAHLSRKWSGGLLPPLLSSAKACPNGQPSLSATATAGGQRSHEMTRSGSRCICTFDFPPHKASVGCPDYFTRLLSCKLLIDQFWDDACLMPVCLPPLQPFCRGCCVDPSRIQQTDCRQYPWETHPGDSILNNKRVHSQFPEGFCPNMSSNKEVQTAGRDETNAVLLTVLLTFISRNQYISSARVSMSVWL